jgi:anti-sigma factor RsiW
MGCEQWTDKLDAYVDGELDPAESRVVGEHMRTCQPCASDALERVQMKRAVQIAGKRYTASAEFRHRIAMSLAAKSSASEPRRRFSFWQILAAPALALLIISLATNFYMGRENARRRRVYSELADLHVAALASATPVDVISSDRHTVKPWFQGKIPFSFNLPELQGSQFTLLGGRVTYFAQTPGAHLIYQLRKHEISVFIFQDRAFESRGEEAADLPGGLAHALSFNVENWSQNGLRYFVVGDVSADDIQALSKLLRDAG